VDMWAYKKSMHRWFLDEWLPKLNIDTTVKAVIREVCADFKSFRGKMGYRNQDTPPEQAFRAGWPKSAELALTLIEDTPICYRSQF